MASNFDLAGSLVARNGEWKAPSGRELAAVRLTEGVTGSYNKLIDKLYSCFVL